jgi:hypothetical protein
MREPPRLLASVAALIATTIAPHADAIVLPLARGADATFSVVISNSTSSDIPLATFEGLAPLPWVRPEYSVTTLNPTICSIGYGSLNGTLFESFEISAISLAARSAVTCSIHVHRAALSYYAFEAGFQPASGLSAGVTLSDTSWIFGPVADLSIASQQIDPFPSSGNRIGLVEVTVSNKGPWDIQHADFGYCQDTALAPFILDNGLPGGCGVAQSGPDCFGTGAGSVQFGIGPLAAGQSKSCMLRVTSNAPLTTPIGFPLFLVGEPQSASGEYPADPDPSDNMTTLAIAPSSTSAVPFGDANWIVLLGLALTGSMCASRRSN